MKVKPTDPNAVIRDPRTKRQLPAEGAEVPDNVFWNRRLIAGDVQLVKASPTAPLSTTKAAPLTTREGK